MCPTASAGSTPLYRRVMVFVDGGYLREGFKRIYRHERINFKKLLDLFERETVAPRIHPEIIRAYYYDAIVDPEEDLEEFKRQKEYYSEIEYYGEWTVRLTRLKKTNRGMRQKGADVKLAVDMVTKALMNHYDIAFLLTGDDDFLDLVKAVKDLTDKKIYGAFYPGHISEDLLKSFDRVMAFTKEFLDEKEIPQKKRKVRPELSGSQKEKG